MPASRSVAAEDLIRLRDFGGMGFSSYPGPAMSVSPDGRHIALQLRQADSVTNRYCTGIIVVPTDEPNRARAVADGGDVVRLDFDKYGISGIVSGAPNPSVIRWSPDGQWIAFTKARGGVLQIWRVRPDGSEETQLTHSPINILDFRWSADSRGIVFNSRPGLAVAENEIDAEGRSGFHYDGRFWNLAGNRPHPLSTIPIETYRLDLGSGAVRVANEADAALFRPNSGTPAPSQAVRAAASPDGFASAWIAPDRPDALMRPYILHVTRGGTDIPCSADTCRDVVDLWWVDQGATLLFLRRQGFGRGSLGLYRWAPGKTTPNPILITDDVLLDCQMGAQDLFCAHEAATKPRRIVRIDPQSGAMRVAFDPNPEFAALKLSPAERLHWRNAFGIDTFGDLVLPPDHKPSERLPLIVVQYDTRGFLLGGTADEFPIQLFAAHGFAVLSFNRPAWYALKGPPMDAFAFLQANQKDWIDRRSVQSSLEIGVRLLINRGLVDPKRIGITGQSDGASTATFALIHSRLFAAASLSTCCEEPAMMATLGPGFQDWYARSGYPRPGEDRPDFWEMSSLVQNVGSLRRTPLLIQAGDEEFRLALETYEAVKAAGWPAEMFVFPGESHVKIQPAHRLAVYTRNLDWFECWLRPRSDDRSCSFSAARSIQTAR